MLINVYTTPLLILSPMTMTREAGVSVWIVGTKLSAKDAMSVSQCTLDLKERVCLTEMCAENVTVLPAASREQIWIVKR